MNVRLVFVLVFSALSFSEAASKFSCPSAAEVPRGTFSSHAHAEDCRKYYVCVQGVATEYGCPIGTVFKIGSAEGTGNCDDPEDVSGCENYYGNLDLKNVRKSELLSGLHSSSSMKASLGPKSRKRPSTTTTTTTEKTN